MSYLEQLEGAMDTDIENIMSQGLEPKKKTAKRLTKKMVLDGAMATEMSEVNTLMLRDQGIEEFDDVRGPDGFKLIELFNIECLLASHNHINHLFGI